MIILVQGLLYRDSEGKKNCLHAEDKHKN